MKISTIKLPSGATTVAASIGDQVLDLNAASRGELPPSMLAFLELGDSAMAKAKALVADAKGGRARSGLHKLSTVELLARRCRAVAVQVAAEEVDERAGLLVDRHQRAHPLGVRLELGDGLRHPLGTAHATDHGLLAQVPVLLRDRELLGRARLVQRRRLWRRRRTAAGP